MNLIQKLCSNSTFRAVVSALLSWLMGEAARFASRYLPVAIGIVREAATMDAPNEEKRRYAADKLRVTLKEQGVEAAEHAINGVIEMAVAELKRTRTEG